MTVYKYQIKPYLLIIGDKLYLKGNINWLSGLQHWFDNKLSVLTKLSSFYGLLGFIWFIRGCCKPLFLDWTDTDKIVCKLGCSKPLDNVVHIH